MPTVRAAAKQVALNAVGGNLSARTPSLGRPATLSTSAGPERWRWIGGLPASATSQVRADVGLGDSAGGPAVPIGGLPTIQRARRPIRSAATPSISSCPASLHIILLPACSPTPQAWELVGPVSTSAAAVPRPPHSTTSSETPTGKIQAAWQHFARPNLSHARPDCALSS